MKTGKRWLAMVLSVLLLCASVPMVAAEESFIEGGLTYTVVNGGAVITGCEDVSGKLTIPPTLGGYPVIGIDDYAFHVCLGLTDVVIPDGVISIGDYAFSGCTGLESITIPSSVTSVGVDAFSGCDKATIYGALGSYVTYIVTGGNAIIMDCSKDASGEIIIPPTLCGYPVTEIGFQAFDGCSGLTSITLPDSVITIGWLAFMSCEGLTSFVIPDSVTTVGQASFAYCSGLTSVVVPDSVTYINMNAFLDSDNVTIYGVAGSYAQTYAAGYGIPFKEILDAAGNVNRDDAIDSKDARLVLQYAVDAAELTEEQQTAADVNSDGAIDSKDARAILQIAVA